MSVYFGVVLSPKPHNKINTLLKKNLLVGRGCDTGGCYQREVKLIDSEGHRP